MFSGAHAANRFRRIANFDLWQRHSCARTADAAEPRYHLKSAEPWLTASVLYEFMRITTMPLFFVLAGWSAVTALRTREPLRFLLERVTRLFVPLVAGILLFGSIIKYIELSQGRDIGLHGFRLVEALQIGFFDFFPRNMMRANC